MSKFQKGHEVSKETRKKISLTLRGNIPWNKGIKCPETAREKNGNWKENKVTYAGIHGWISRIHGIPNKCERCNTVESKRFMWHNISGNYLRDKSDWLRICAKCHANIHKPWEKRIYA